MKRIVIAALAAILIPGIALAQSPRPRPVFTGNPIEDIKNATGGGASQVRSNAAEAVGNALLKPLQDLATFIGDDIDEAIRLSTAIDGLKDGHGQQCLIGLRDFGNVVTFHLASDLEALRLQQMAINKLCTNVHCTQVFGDFTNFVQAASPIPLPVPSLHDICAKIPQVAVADPIPLPTSVPTAPATPAPAQP